MFELYGEEDSYGYDKGLYSFLGFKGESKGRRGVYVYNNQEEGLVFVGSKSYRLDGY